MKLKTRANVQPARWYRGADIPMRVIRRFARQVAGQAGSLAQVGQAIDRVDGRDRPLLQRL
jgi:hypothetical protein